MQLESGTLIGGRYRLDRQLGRGGMGEVWAAMHTVTRRDVALKFLNVDDNTLPQMHRRFLREARAASAVIHPNVIQIQDVFELEDGTPVMVMDLLDGEALGDRLAREGSLPVDETARILAPVVSAVGTAHAAGIVHRDLKPENIFLALTANGEMEVKVLDFGIAKLGSALETDGAGNITGTGAVLGTPFYMALEQAYGEKDIDHRADIWALGVILYECLAGVRPVVGDNFGQIVKHLTHGRIPPLTEVAPHVPAELSRMVGKMLERAREDRPDDLREVLLILRRYTGARARTFGGPRAPLTSPTPEGGEVVRVDANRHHVLDDTRVDSANQQNPEATIEVVSVVPRPRDSDARRADAGRADAGRADAGRADAGRADAGRADAGRADAGPSSAAVSSRRGPPGKVRVSTGKKASPVDVTMAESAAPVPAPPPPASRRTLVIAAGGGLAGILATALVVMAMRPAAAPIPAVTAPLQSARVAGAGTEATPVPPRAAEQLPAAPTPEPIASTTTAPSGSAARRPGPLPTSSPSSPSASLGALKTPSAATSARPATAPTTTPVRKSGLVDDPPF